MRNLLNHIGTRIFAVILAGTFAIIMVSSAFVSHQGLPVYAKSDNAEMIALVPTSYKPVPEPKVLETFNLVKNHDKHNNNNYQLIRENTLKLQSIRSTI
jgi:hypothetical protein